MSDRRRKWQELPDEQRARCLTLLAFVYFELPRTLPATELAEVKESLEAACELLHNAGAS